MAIQQHVQEQELGGKIELFQIDLSMFDEESIYITPGDEGAASHTLTFDGQAYSPYPVQADGFEVSAKGPLPRPTLTLANNSGVLSGLVKACDFFRGAMVTRLVTFEKFLDDGDDPDPEAILERDVYIVRRPLARVPRTGVLAFELGSLMDLQDTYLPGRVVIRDFCDLPYRIYNTTTGDFDYVDGGCPYTGDTYLNEQDQPCEKSADACSKRLVGGCKGRFGANAELPFGGFPGVSRYRAR